MLEIGSLVDGKYKILRVVGKGGMSVVYQAVNEKANKIWAVKEIRKDGVQNYEVVKQNLIVETELLKRFNHPNLPSIIDVIDTDDCFLIVMDYIEGNSLSRALKESGAQSQEDVIEWSKQLCDVLGYLHSRKPPIIYRDMKPGNVMLKPDGKISLIDFGTAREFKSTSVEDTVCLGTQGYAAPEQYGGHGQTDARTDIYCLGATMYHLVTGHNPSKPPYEMYPIRYWNPMLSSGLEEIIIKCTQRNPEDRYQSCAELMYALDHYQDLDIENKKKRNVKWKIFMTSVILTLVMLAGAVGFKIAAGQASSAEYETSVSDAKKAFNSNQYDVAEDTYKEAVEKDPSRIEAYNGLMEIYLSDETMTNAEYTQIASLLSDKNEQRMIAVDPDKYADLCKEIGNNILFYPSDNNASERINDSIATEWYKKAAENYTAEEDRENAEFWVEFSQVFSDPFKEDNMGNAKMTGREYHDLLEKILDENSVSNLNPYQQLKCYDYILTQLAKTNFIIGSGDDRISIDEYYTLVEKIEDKIKAIENDPAAMSAVENSNNKSSALYASIKIKIEEIKNAKKAIESQKNDSSKTTEG